MPQRPAGITHPVAAEMRTRGGSTVSFLRPTELAAPLARAGETLGRCRALVIARGTEQRDHALVGTTESVLPATAFDSTINPTGTPFGRRAFAFGVIHVCSFIVILISSPSAPPRQRPGRRRTHSDSPGRLPSQQATRRQHWADQTPAQVLARFQPGKVPARK